MVLLLMEEEITFGKIEEIILSELPKSIRNNVGLVYFAKNRSKFEGWLQVELCSILGKHFPEHNITPEKTIPKQIDQRTKTPYWKIDLIFDKFAFELKVVNTPFYEDYPCHWDCPLSTNISDILADVDKLLSLTETSFKGFIFVVFPLVKESNDYNKRWEKTYLKKLKNVLDLNPRSFNFLNGIPGILYIGKLKKQ